MEPNKYSKWRVLWAVAGFALALGAVIFISRLTNNPEISNSALAFWPSLCFLPVLVCGIMTWRRGLKLEAVALLLLSLAIFIPVINLFLPAVLIGPLLGIVLIYRLARYLSGLSSLNNTRAGKMFAIMSLGLYLIGAYSMPLNVWLLDSYGGHFAQDWGEPIGIMGIPIIAAILGLIFAYLAYRRGYRAEGIALVLGNAPNLIPLFGTFVGIFPPIAWLVMGLVKGIGQYRLPDPAIKVSAMHYLIFVILSGVIIGVVAGVYAYLYAWGFAMGIGR